MVRDILTRLQLDELWDSMCQNAITLITNALHTVASDDLLLKIKGRIALFMFTMEVNMSIRWQRIQSDDDRNGVTQCPR